MTWICGESADSVGESGGKCTPASRAGRPEKGTSERTHVEVSTRRRQG